MAKKNKENVEINNTSNEKQTPLTENELYDVLKFATNYYQYASGNSGIQFDGFYTPSLTNERLGEIGLNPRDIAPDKISLLLESPIVNQNNLIGYSELLQLRDAVARRSRNYLGNLPAFDYTFTCKNIKDPSEYKSKEYLDDLNIVKDFLSHFDVRGQFAYINRRTFDIDAFYGVFRMDGANYEFQELPYQYCKITGKNLDWGFQYDFDMSWFLRMGLSFDK